MDERHRGPKGPNGAKNIKRAKRELRLLAGSLWDKDDEKTRNEIRKKMEVISILYACMKGDGDEFRKNVALAVDLSGIRHEAAAAAKVKAAKKAQAQSAKADTIRRQKLVEKEQERGGKEETF